MYIINGIDIDELDVNNEKDVRELIKLIRKDVFNNLSVFEQDKIIDKFVELTTSSEGLNKVGFIKGNNKVNAFEPQRMREIIDDLGVEGFKNLLRKSFTEGLVDMSVVRLCEIEDLMKKMEDGTISEDEISNLKDLLHKSSYTSDRDEVEFSTFAILNIYTSSFSTFNEEDKDGDLKLAKDAEPFILSAYISFLASFLSNTHNPIGKMFMKHGLEKTLLGIDDISADIGSLIINHCQENNIAPENAIMAMLNLLKTMATPLDTRLNYESDRIEEVFSGLCAAIFDKPELNDNDDDEYDEDEEESSDESTTKSANADNMESKNNKDIKKLLFDD